MKFDIEKKIKIKKIKKSKFITYEVYLYVDGVFLNFDRTTSHEKAVQKAIKQPYWNMICNLLPRNKNVLVRLSGLHFHLDTFIAFLKKEDEYPDRILHYHNWPRALPFSHDSDCYALIICDKNLLKKIYDEYWFSLGAEIRFEIFISKVDYSKIYFKSVQTEAVLYRNADIIIDSLNNGFHFNIFKQI